MAVRKNWLTLYMQMRIIDATMCHRTLVIQHMALLWEKFIGGPTRAENTSFSITINAKNVITFNKYARKMLGHPEGVLLLFEKKDR